MFKLSFRYLLIYDDYLINARRFFPIRFDHRMILKSDYIFIYAIRRVGCSDRKSGHEAGYLSGFFSCLRCDDIICWRL